MLGYLDATDARRRLILGGIFTEETCPRVEVLESVLEEVEARIDGWLGMRMAVTRYTETLRANDNGIGLTNQYPIARIISAESVAWQSVGLSVPTQPRAMVSWEGAVRTVQVGSCQQIRLTYEAGYEPLPSILVSIVYTILRRSAANGASIDLDWLDKPVRDAQSITLPGGLSKTFKVSSGSASAQDGAGTSELDRLMMPLSRYRRTILTTIA